MSEFNLIDERWIPCIDLRGKPVEYGIHETLLKAHELREICDDSPLVTVAIHRLLLAILYRAHDGPRAFTAWKSMYSLVGFDKQVVGCYLTQWKERFDIFSDDRPFYQMASLETKVPVPVNRLATECASGNNATLFDHSDDEIEANWTQVQAVRHLVACQSFALGFGKSGNAKIGGVEEALPYSADAIALRGMNIWLQGTNLFETLSVNLVPIDDVSAPPWELEASNAYRDRLQDKSRKAVTSLGVVDRLTWQSRLIRLIPNGNTVSRIYYTQGRSADKSAGDPMKVYRTSKDEGISALSLSSGKAAWRDAHSILTIPSAGSNEQRPECFNLVARALGSYYRQTIYRPDRGAGNGTEKSREVPALAPRADAYSRVSDKRFRSHRATGGIASKRGAGGCRDQQSNTKDQQTVPFTQLRVGRRTSARQKRGQQGPRCDRPPPRLLGTIGRVLLRAA